MGSQSNEYNIEVACSYVFMVSAREFWTKSLLTIQRGNLGSGQNGNSRRNVEYKFTPWFVENKRPVQELQNKWNAMWMIRRCHLDLSN